MKTNSVTPQEDLQAIREIMERSSKFLSLSGLSGVFAGFCALAGAAMAGWVILQPDQLSYREYIQDPELTQSANTGLYLAVDALLVLTLAVTGAVLFSARKARSAGTRLWTVSTRRLIGHMSVPLVTGGAFAIILVMKGMVPLVAPVLLIFYGLSLVNAGKFTLGEIHYLGLTQIILGIVAAVVPQYGLIIWTIGFGIMHIIYGAVMYYRHEHQSNR